MEILSYIFQGIFTAILWLWWILVPIFGLAAWQNFRKAKWAEKQEHVLLTIKIPRSNDKDPTAAEMMFAALHGILRPNASKMREGSMQEYLAFEMVAKTDAIHFYVGVPKKLRDFVESQVYAQYPSAEINEAEDYTKDIDIDDDGINDAYSCAELKLRRDDIIPIKTFQNFKVDPLAGITSALAKLDGENEQVWIQILTRPVPDEWQRKGIAYIHAKKTGQSTFTTYSSTEGLLKFFLYLPLKLLSELVKALMSAEETKKEAPKLAPDIESSLSAIEEKVTKLGFQVKVRIISLAKTKAVSEQRLMAAIGAFKQFNTINLNSIVAKRVTKNSSFLQDFRSRAFYDKGFILNIEELASLYHLPHTSVETPNINWTSSKTGEPPINLPNPLNTSEDDLTFFAETNFRHQKVKFGIKTDDRRRHTYIIGKSGMGKSKLLEQMMEEDIRKGNGFAVIDPNGDLIVDALKKIPKERINDVILLDPADQNFPIGFNPLEVEDENLKHFVAQGFVGILAKLFGHSWGPRLEYILNYTILALLDYPESTVLGIVRMLTDKNFRKKVIKEIKDPVVKKFWTTEFASYNEKFATEAVAPILNKVGQFTASAMIRNIIGQPKSSFDIREAMDNNKILLINLSTGRIGEVNSSLLGGMIITKIQLAAMSRANVAPEDRVDFILYVDEFQHFATESFATILSEARKYKLSLIVANQYIAQMDETVKDAVFGNVGTMITFRVGAQDAGVLEKELNPPFEVNDIINLDRQQIYLKMTIGGKTSNPFSAKTLTIPDIDLGNTEEIIKSNRAKYSRRRDLVEADIARWNNIDMENDDDDIGTSAPKAVSPEENKVPKNESKFEAPLAKPLNNNNQSHNQKSIKTNHPTINNNQNREIKTEKKAQEAPQAPRRENENNKHQHKPKNDNRKEPRKVDRDAIRNIIAKALVVEKKPVEKEKEETKVIKHEDNIKEKNDSKPTVETAKDISPEITKHKEIETKEESKREGTVEKIEPTKKDTDGHHRIEKSEKVITPENFKGIKEIHPHEKVIIKKENQETKELKLGETIIFEDHKEEESK